MDVGEVNPPIIIVDKDHLVETPVSLDSGTANGPTTVLAACEDERRLIAMLRSAPALYDGRHPRFRDDAYKEQLWQSIATKLDIELTQCLVTWSELRYRYQRHVRQLRAFRSSRAVLGKASIRRRPYLRHEEELLFLYPHVARYPLLTFEASQAKDEGNDDVVQVPEVEIVESPVVDIIDVDLVGEDAFAFHCTSENRRLIQAVSAYPQLYDPQHPNYSNFRHRGIIWGSISNELRDKATKLIKSWIKLLTRYEWEVQNRNATDRESELYQLMAFLRPHVMRLRGSVCQISKYLQTGWHEPIENFRSVLTLINAMRARPEQVQMIDDLPAFRSKPPGYDDVWRRVEQSVGLGHERCEVTWLVMRSFHKELLAMRQAGYQLQDKWYFENALNGIVRLANASVPGKRFKRLHNGEGSEEPPAKVASLSGKIVTSAVKVVSLPAKVAAPPIAKVVPPPSAKPEPPRLPIAIVYPPAMKTKSTSSGSAMPSSSSTSNIPATTSISGSSSSDLSLQSFAIPTIRGSYRLPHPVGKLTSPVKISTAPTSVVLNQHLAQRPGLQISVRHQMRMPTPAQTAATITIPSAMIRPVTPPSQHLSVVLPSQHLAATTATATASPSSQHKATTVTASPPALTWQRQKPPSAALEALLGEKNQLTQISINQGAQSSAGGRPAINRIPLKAVSSSEPAPMVRIHQAGLYFDSEAGKGTTLSALGSEGRAEAAAGHQAGTGAGTKGTLEAGVGEASTGAGAATEATSGARVGLGTGSGGEERTDGVLQLMGTRTTYPEMCATQNPNPRTTFQSMPEEYVCSSRGIVMNAINVNLVSSPSAGNSLHIWGGGLTSNYYLNMVRTATLIREVMAVPQLHHKDPQLKAQSDGFWQTISMKFHMPEVALRACWNFLANNMSLFPTIAPMSELMRNFKSNMKVWEKSNRLFGKFDEIARKYNWMKHRDVLPQLIRHFRQHEHLYWEMRKPRPGESVSAPPQNTEKERQEVWRLAKIQFPDLNHHDIWSMFKFAFRTYMEDLERGIENPWPQNWWQSLEQLKFLVNVRYHPLEPYFYIVHNKILEEVKRCSMFEALSSSDSSVDRGSTAEVLTRICKEPMPWCSEEAKRLLTGRLSSFASVDSASDPNNVPVPLIDLDGAPETETAAQSQSELESQTESESETQPEPEAESQTELEPEIQPHVEPELYISPRIRQVQDWVRRPAYTLPTIAAFELTRMLRRYPHTFMRASTINKRTAWVRVSKELKVTVTECRLGLQYALREMRFLKLTDPKKLCTMGNKYYRHMSEIFRQVTTKSQLTVRTPEQMNNSITVVEPSAEAAEDEVEVEPHSFVPEINMSTCKAGLVLKNWAHAVGSLHKDSQDNVMSKMKELFAKYSKLAEERGQGQGPGSHIS